MNDLAAVGALAEHNGNFMRIARLEFFGSDALRTVRRFGADFAHPAAIERFVSVHRYLSGYCGQRKTRRAKAGYDGVMV